MKKLFILILLYEITSISSYGQDFMSGKIVPEIESFQLDSTLDLTSKNDSIDFDKFYFSPPKKLNLQMPNISESLASIRNHLSLDLNQEQIDMVPNPEMVYSIKILKPSGNYHMKIYEPDSTNNYTLLIRRF